MPLFPFWDPTWLPKWINNPSKSNKNVCEDVFPSPLHFFTVFSPIVHANLDPRIPKIIEKPMVSISFLHVGVLQHMLRLGFFFDANMALFFTKNDPNSHQQFTPTAFYTKNIFYHPKRKILKRCWLPLWVQKGIQNPPCSLVFVFFLFLSAFDAPWIDF